MSAQGFGLMRALKFLRTVSWVLCHSEGFLGVLCHSFFVGLCLRLFVGVLESVEGLLYFHLLFPFFCCSRLRSFCHCSFVFHSRVFLCPGAFDGCLLGLWCLCISEQFPRWSLRIMLASVLLGKHKSDNLRRPGGSVGGGVAVYEDAASL